MWNKILSSLLKPLTILNIVVGIISLLFIPKYLVYLFYAGILRFYEIPEIYLEIGDFGYMSAGHLFLIQIFTYSTIFFAIIYINIFFVSQLFSDNKIKNKQSYCGFFIVFILIIALGILLGSSITVIGLVISSLITLLLFDFFTEDKIFFKIGFYIYFFLSVLFFSISYSGGYIVNKGSEFAERRLTQTNFSNFVLNNSQYIIVGNYKNKVIAKEIKNSKIDNTFQIFDLNSIENVVISVNQFPNLSK